MKIYIYHMLINGVPVTLGPNHLGEKIITNKLVVFLAIEVVYTKYFGSSHDLWAENGGKKWQTSQTPMLLFCWKCQNVKHIF